MFGATPAAVTRDAVGLVTRLYHRLAERRAAPLDELRDFVLQSVWCMFAEDLRRLDGHVFTRVVDELLAHPERSSADDLGGLFEWLNREGPRPPGGLYVGTRFVNGGLFRQPARVHLDREEMTALGPGMRIRLAPRREPHLFGSLLEGALGRGDSSGISVLTTRTRWTYKRSSNRASLDPWRERIENADTFEQARVLREQALESRRARPRMRLRQLPIHRIPRVAQARAPATRQGKRAPSSRRTSPRRSAN